MIYFGSGTITDMSFSVSQCLTYILENIIFLIVGNLNPLNNSTKRPDHTESLQPTPIVLYHFFFACQNFL